LFHYQFVIFPHDRHAALNNVSAAAWAEFGQGLGAGAFKNLEKLEIHGMS
jgi:hypothetical protein